MPAKLAIDRAYVERQSLWLDLKILAATALAPLRLERLIRPRPRGCRAGTAAPDELGDALGGESAALASRRAEAAPADGPARGRAA